MIKLRQLEAFNAVMLAGTVTGAAARLKISQPAISDLVSALEQLLGFDLFVREKNRLQPTDEARYFHGAVIQVLEGLRRLDQLALDIRDANAGTLRIAALPMLALDFLPRLAARFMCEHPDVHVVLQARSSPTVVGLIATQQFDLGFAEGDCDPALVEAQRMRLRCVCVLPVGHPLTAKSILRPEDLSGLPLVAAARDHIRTERLAEIFLERGASLRVKIETPLFASMCAIVGAGYGYGIVDPLTARRHGDDGLVIREFEPPFFTEFAILFPIGRPRSLIAKRFLDTVLSELARFGPLGDLADRQREESPG